MIVKEERLDWGPLICIDDDMVMDEKDVPAALKRMAAIVHRALTEQEKGNGEETV